MKFRRCVLGFLCLVLAMSLALAPLGAAAEKGKIYKSTENGVRIREKPQSGSAVIGKLHKNEKVIHLSTKHNWWRIKTSSGLTGNNSPFKSSVTASPRSIVTGVSTSDMRPAGSVAWLTSVIPFVSPT